ncbi:MAG: hypothetical protein HZB38_01460 [Planctomycetes bacterium]|nr:hypothetical protein [Planctomycetota bacterium]
MFLDANVRWVLVIAASALVGWWLAVRPGATFRGAAASMSCLIMVMAILMCVLAIQGQESGRSSRAAAPQRLTAAVPR